MVTVLIHISPGPNILSTFVPDIDVQAEATTKRVPLGHYFSKSDVGSTGGTIE